MTIALISAFCGYQPICHSTQIKRGPPIETSPSVVLAVSTISAKIFSTPTRKVLRPPPHPGRVHVGRS